MARSFRSGNIAVVVLSAGLLGGCAPPASFQIETEIHPDGSCDRTIWQPKEEFLPDHALKPEWNARWKSVENAGLPDFVSSTSARKKQAYFRARGSFRTPDEIPDHYRYLDKEHPELGVSEIRRSYARNDYGFVVEHRWRERITNIVTLPQFVTDIDDCLDQMIPVAIKRIEEKFRNRYDPSGLVNYIQTDIKRALRETALSLYDSFAHRRSEQEVKSVLARVARRYDLDLLDDKGRLVSDEEAGRRAESFVRQLIHKRIRHIDGTALTDAEVDAFVRGSDSLGLDELWNTPSDKPANEDTKRTIVKWEQLTGLYNPLAFFLVAKPRYRFTLRLPGRLVETNGTILEPDKSRWEFTSDQLFPDGYEMKARSILIDRDLQKKLLGQVVIESVLQAQEYMDTVGEEGPLLNAVRTFCKSGDPSPLRDFQPEKRSDRNRAARLREMLRIK